MKPLISVIVPIYNVEKYLQECVDSILNQTYTNLEVILVDDGSPDGCPAMCDAYAVKDSRIKVIHKENGGLSDARNVGMLSAAGDYFSFVDSDDILPDTALETLLSIAKRESAELVIGGHSRFTDVPDPLEPQNKKVVRFTPVEAMEDMLKNGCASWGRLYCSELHRDILFPVGEINEDEAVVLRLLEKCTGIAVTNEIVYYYRCRPESITTMKFSVKKLDWYRHCVDNLTWIEKKYPDLVSLAYDRLGSCVLFLVDEMVLSGCYDILQSSGLLNDLKCNHRIYIKHSRSGMNAKLRMVLLRYLPYKVYRCVMLFRRRMERHG